MLLPQELTGKDNYVYSHCYLRVISNKHEQVLDLQEHNCHKTFLLMYVFVEMLYVVIITHHLRQVRLIV